jgi:hypothetical protein
MDDFHETPSVEKRCATCRHSRHAYKILHNDIGWLEMFGFHPKAREPNPRVAGKLICWHPDYQDVFKPVVVLDMAVCSAWEAGT